MEKTPTKPGQITSFRMICNIRKCVSLPSWIGDFNKSFQIHLLLADRRNGTG
uniref:Uncharacterized protein n=1 Tax=Utricularia reniformis TaxID=192314 RepID=A0A1Y0B059_9LAMI|nr:hypothetical protein AEK19_MT0570 [Utricularia reniformis]ART30826.1 hypothetical protein AEK19_MT0570 [Utricularia reniformis]